MKFSVTIPAYKPEFLQEAIESVQSQSYPDWELIIVDDCSPTDIQSIVAPFMRDPRISYYRNNKNFGAINVVDNWNRCLSYCTGDYVICMGDDDKLLPGCLEEYEKLMSSYPYLGVYHTRTQIIDRQSTVLETLEERPDYEHSLYMLYERLRGSRTQFIGDYCFNTRLLRENGGFYKLPLAWGSDDISSYMAAKGDGNAIKDGIANTNRPGFQYRSHTQTISNNRHSRIKLEAMIAMKEWLLVDLKARKRKEPGDVEIITKSEQELINFIRSRALYFVRGDAAERHRGLFHWIQRKEDIFLTSYEILVQFTKGVLAGNK